MLCSYCYSCIKFHDKIVIFQLAGCLQHLRHVCQGEYEGLDCINREGVEQKLCHNFVENFGGGTKFRGFLAGVRHHCGRDSSIVGER